MIHAIKTQQDHIYLALPTLRGRLYTVESTDDLSPPGWQPLAPLVDIAGTGGTLWLSTTNSPGARFYRANVRLAP